MGFVLDGLDAEDYDRNYSDRTLVRRILNYFRPHTRTMATVAGMVVLASLAEAIIPIVVSRGIDMLTGHPTAQLLLGLAGFVTVLGSLGWFFNFIRQTLSAQAVGDVVLALREDASSRAGQRGAASAPPPRSTPPSRRPSAASRSPRVSGARRRSTRTSATPTVGPIASG